MKMLEFETQLRVLREMASRMRKLSTEAAIAEEVAHKARLASNKALEDFVDKRREVRELAQEVINEAGN